MGNLPWRSVFSMNEAPPKPLGKSVLLPVDYLSLLKPGHHVPQLLAYLFDLMRLSHLRKRREYGLICPVLKHPFFRESPGLYFREYLFHLFLGLAGNDPRPPGEVAVLGGIANGVSHVGYAAFIYEIDYELHLMEAFEIRHLRRVAGLNRRFKASGDE